MGLQIQLNSVTIILAITATLSACGGGDGGGGGGDPVTSNPTPRALMTIDSSNADSTSGAAYDGIATQQNSGISNVSEGSTSIANSSQSIDRVIQNYQTLKNNDQATLASGAITAGTRQCSGGGTISVTSNSIAYTDCRENYPDGSYDITNGSAIINNLQQSGNELSCTERVSGTFIFENLNDREYDRNSSIINNTSINGSMTITSTQALVNTVCNTTSSLTGDYLSIKSNNDFVSFFNFNITGKKDSNLNYSYSYNLILDSSVLSGSLKIETISPLVGVETDPYPTSGHLRYTANSSSPGVPAIVDVNIGNGVVTLTVDVDGTSGTDVGYPKTFTWSEFDAL